MKFHSTFLKLYEQSYRPRFRVWIHKSSSKPFQDQNKEMVYTIKASIACDDVIDNNRSFHYVHHFLSLIFKGNSHILPELLDLVIVSHYDSCMSFEVCARCRTLISTQWNQLKKLSWNLKTVLINKFSLHDTVVWKMPHTADIMH